MKKFTKLFIWFFLMTGIIFGTSTVFAEASQEVIVRFCDSSGKPIDGISEQVIQEGGSIVLPVAPEMTTQTVVGKPSWKTTLFHTEGTQYFESEMALSYEAARDWIIDNGNVLTLYGTKVCTFRYFTSDGSRQIGGDYRAYEGAEITFRRSPDSKNLLYRGWSKFKRGAGVWAGFGKPYIMDQDRDLYLVEYVRVAFRDANGSTNNTFNKMEKIMKRGSEFTLPAVPRASNYRNLGWADSENASRAKYADGEKIKVTESMTLYAARQYLPYAVTFNNNTGTSKEKAFRDLYVRAAKNEAIKLPKVPRQKGYVALGWSTRIKSKKAEFKEGQEVRITRKTKFYAVYRKAKRYNVAFCMGDGTTNQAYKALNRTVTEHTVITLPQVPPRKGYVSTGWMLKTSSRAKEYKPGDKVKIYGHCKFQAIQEQATSVVLHKTRGAVYKTVYVARGDSFKVPSCENPEGYTFMGWSARPNVVITEGKPAQVQYEAGDVIPSVRSTIHLYQVMYKRSTEKNIISSQMAKPNMNRYGGVIMVGDSRTVRMRQALDAQNCDSNIKNVRFVGASGQGLKWFKETGYPLLKTQVEHLHYQSKRPIAIVFNLGVNDLYKVMEYVSFMREIAPELKGMNCELYYMSVNPLNSKMIEKTGRLSLRSEESVRRFNTRLRVGLGREYTYIDSYSWLMRNGYSTNNGVNGKDNAEDDGLHYTVKTYKRIFDYCIQFINTK